MGFIELDAMETDELELTMTDGSNRMVSMQAVLADTMRHYFQQIAGWHFADTEET